MMTFRSAVRNVAAGILVVSALPGWIMPAAAAAETAAAAAETTGSSAPSPSPTLSRDLQVMTFNIRLGSAADGPDRWQVRRPRLIEVMRRHRADVIGLQEAQIGQIDDLRATFPRYQFLGAGRLDGQTAGEFSPIMYDTRRLQALRSDTFWLSETPTVPGSRTWGNRFERICTWAHFRDLKTGRCFYLYNTHLDHQSQPSREKSTALILRHIDARLPRDPVILTGDLNAGERNPVNAACRQAGLCDTFRVIHPDAPEAGTTNAFKPRRGPNKIDYIYTDPSWSVRHAAILTDKVDGRWPSDHLPVTATISPK